MSSDEEAELESPAVATGRLEDGPGRVSQVLVVIATYNEIENLPRLVQQIQALAAGLEILIIDDASPDGTGLWAADHVAQHAGCHLISRGGKWGLGSATLTGFAWALQRDYSHVLTMDADFSHDPRDIPALLQAAGVGTTESPSSCLPVGSVSEPIVIGSRYVRGGRIEGWPWTRRWASRWINRFARFWLRLPTRDNSGAFRLYPVAWLRRLPLAKIRNQGYGYLEEILYLALQQGATFVEVPITFRDRTRGQSKINAREALTALGTLLRLPFR